MPDRRPDSSQAGSPMGATHENQISPKQERGSAVPVLEDNRPNDSAGDQGVLPARQRLSAVVEDGDDRVELERPRLRPDSQGLTHHG